MSDDTTTDEKPVKPADIVAEAKKRFQRAQEAYNASRILAVADTKFALGDSDNGWQWPDDIRNTRKMDKRVCLTINSTAQHCNQIINAIRQNRPAVKVSPVDNGGDKETANILGGLIRGIQAYSAADDAHDVAAEHAVLGGEGYWRIVTEYETPDSFNQCIKIKPCPNPQLVLIDPDCKELDKSDAEYGFVFEDITKEQFKREHPGIDPESWGEEVIKTGWAEKDTVRIADYYYVTYEKDTACLLSDGRSMLKSQLVAKPQPVMIVKERPTQVKRWTWCKLVGGHDAPVESTDWLGEYLPIVAVVGKELNVNGEVVRKGMVRDLKDPARMQNYAYSETVQTLALQNKVPYLASAESIDGYEEIWKSANIENRAYLPYNAFDDEGRPLQLPQRQPPAVMPAAQVQLLELSANEMRAASGQQNSNFGIKSEAQSGIGIQRLKVQGEIATFHFPDNLARALRYEAKVLIDLIQKYYDTSRVVRILGLDGKHESALLHPDLPGAYAEQADERGEIQKIFNPTVGRYDVTIDTGPAYQTQRQEAFAALSEIASRNPALMQVAGDIIMQAADFPMAEKLAERLAKMLPPQLQDNKPGQDQVSPQVMQQMQTMRQQMEHMGQALEEAHRQLQESKSGEQAKMMAEQSKTEREMAALQAKRDRELEQARMDAEVELEKARIAGANEVQLEQMRIESAEEIEEMRGYFDLLKARAAAPSPALTADVEGEFAPEAAETPPLPRIIARKLIKMQAPSGAVYTGTIEDDAGEAVA